MVHIICFILVSRLQSQCLRGNASAEAGHFVSMPPGYTSVLCWTASSSCAPPCSQPHLRAVIGWGKRTSSLRSRHLPFREAWSRGYLKIDCASTTLFMVTRPKQVLSQPKHQNTGRGRCVSIHSHQHTHTETQK